MIVMADVDTELMRFLRDSVISVMPGDARGLADAIRSASLESKPDVDKTLHRIFLAKGLSKKEGLLRFAQIVTSGEIAPSAPIAASQGI
jgi:hypothetical protein